MGKVEDALRSLIRYHGKRVAKELLGEMPDRLRENRRELRSLRKTVEELQAQVGELVEARREEMDVPPAPEEEVEDARFSTRTLPSIRKRFNLTQEELAGLLDVSHATITAWETGKSRPRRNNMARIITLREMNKTQVDEALARERAGARWSPGKLKSLRKKLGLRQDEAAQLLDVSVGTISGWETGRTQPSRKSLAAIAGLQELSLSEVNDRLGRAAEQAGGGEPQRSKPPDVSVREVRSELGLSQAELAEKIGVSATTVSNWETGNTRPRAGNVHKLLALKEQPGAEEG